MMCTTLRLATGDDAESVAALYAPVVHDTAITFEVDAPTAQQMHERIVATSLRLPWLVADRGSAIAGFAYASRHRQRAAYTWAADVSVYVAAAARGTGVGRGLYAALLGLLAQQRYAGAFAGIALPNEPSLALHRAAGFTPVGVYRSVGYKLGAWWDVAWWQRALPAAGTTSPPPPLALPELGTDEIDGALREGEAQVDR